jgi:GR25 family glycosyltransferase involved in LPS biosynthesis
MSLNHSLGGLLISDIYCINLKHRKDRKSKFKRQARKKGFPVTFFKAEKNLENPDLGKWNSHIQVWKNSLKNKKTKNVLIFEDDSKILVPGRFKIPPPPENWKMLYLGSNIQRVITDKASDKSAHWKRACALLCHSYVLNRESIKDLLTKANKYLKSVKKSKDKLLPLDEWLCTQYHTENAVYVSIPDRVIQTDGYSDIKCTRITWNQKITARAKFPGDDNDKNTDQIIDESDLTELVKTPMNIVDTDAGNQNVVLSLPKISTEDLPNVTLITTTRNNKSGFYFVIRNFYKLQYPKEKMTWIIADDSDEGKEVKDLIPGNDQRIKYISCKMSKNSFLSVSKKINLCMNYVVNRSEVIVHFADNQYYPEMSLLSRVKVLMAAQERTNGRVKCVGCTDYGVFDIVNNRSYQKYYPDANNNRTILYGPSLCYFKSWWDTRRFDETKYVMETFFFTRGRLHEVIEMPYAFILTTLVADNPDTSEADRYGKNRKTGNNKDLKRDTYSKYSNTDGMDNFFDTWDKETQNFILLLKETLDEEDE